MRFSPPTATAFHSDPVTTWTTADGTRMAAYAHRTERGRHRVTVDGAPFDPRAIVDNATK